MAGARKRHRVDVGSDEEDTPISPKGRQSEKGGEVTEVVRLPQRKCRNIAIPSPTPTDFEILISDPSSSRSSSPKCVVEIEPFRSRNKQNKRRRLSSSVKSDLKDNERKIRKMPPQSSTSSSSFSVLPSSSVPAFLSGPPLDPIQLPDCSSPALSDCLRQFRVWSSLAEEAIEAGVCIGRIHSFNTINALHKFINSSTSVQYNGSRVCSTPDLVAIESIMLSNIIPSIERFFVYVDSLGLINLFDAVEDMKRTSAGREAIHRLSHAVIAVIDSIAALELFSSVMSIPGSAILSDYLSAEQFAESALRLIRTTCVRLISRNFDTAEYRGVKKGKRKKEIDENRELLFPLKWKSDLIKSITSIINSFLRALLVQQLTESFSYQFISFLIDCVVIKAPDSPTDSQLLNSSASDSLIVIASRLPSLRASIDSSLLQQLVPKGLIDLASPIARSRSSAVPSNNRITAEDGLSLHPFTLTLFRLANVLCTPDAPSSELITQFKQKLNHAGAFVRRVCQHLVQLCLGSSVTTVGKRTGVGTLAEMRKNREILRGLILDVCSATASPAFPTAVLFVEYFSRIFLNCSLKKEKNNSSNVWVEESSLLLLADISQFLFTSHFTTRKDRIDIPDFVGDVDGAITPTFCGQCGCSFGNEEAGAKHCNDCQQRFHLSCVDVEKEDAEKDVWTCTSCLLRRTALHIYKTTINSSHRSSKLRSLCSSFGTSEESSDLPSEIFLKYSKSNLIYSFLLFHHVDKISTKESASTLSIVKRTFVNGQSSSEHRSLIPIGVILHSDHPRFTRCALLCLLAKSFISDGSETSTTPSTAASTLVAGDTNISKTDDQGDKIQQALISEYFESEWNSWTANQSHRVSILSQSSLIHRHGVQQLWRQIVTELTEYTRDFILRVLLNVASTSHHPSSRRAALNALSVCLASDPSLVRNNGPPIVWDIVGALRDTAPRVRERAASAIECCWNRIVLEVGSEKMLRTLVRTISTKGIVDVDVPHVNQLPTDKEIIELIQSVEQPFDEDKSPHLHISAFGEVGRDLDSSNLPTRSRPYVALIDACRLLQFLIQIGLPQLSRATSDISTAVRIRAVKSLGRILPSVPIDSPLLGVLAVKMLQRLEVPTECATVHLDICSMFNSIWLNSKSPITRQFLSMDSQPVQLPPTDLDIFVKVLVGLSSSSVAGPSIPLELFINLKKKTKVNRRNRHDVPVPTKSVLDHNLPALSQIIVVGVVTSSYSLDEVDAFLSALTFRLFSLFLLRSKKHKTSMEDSATSSIPQATQMMMWSASQLNIMKAIRLLINTRPIALAQSFVKYLYPYLTEAPKTAADADLLTEFLHVISASLHVDGPEPSRSIKKETEELESSIVNVLIPTGRPSLVEPAVKVLCASTCRITHNFKTSVEPLLTDTLAILLPFRDFMMKIESIPVDPVVSTLRYGMSLLTRHRAQTTAVITIDVYKIDLLKKQWAYVLESIKRRIWLLACLCKSLNLESDMQYDLNEEHKEEFHNVVENEAKDQWEFKTPEPRHRRKSTVERSDEITNSHRMENGSQNDQTGEGRESAMGDLLTTIERASNNSTTSTIAMSRLVRTLLPRMVEEAQQIEQFSKLSCMAPGLPHVEEIPCVNTTPFIRRPVIGSPPDLQRWTSFLDQSHHSLNVDDLPPSIDRLTINFVHEIFELLLDLYQRFDSLLQRIQTNPLNIWLSNSLNSLQSLLLQSIGLFLQREKTYIKSNRVRSVFARALKSWKSPRLQLASLQALSSLLSHFEAAALSEGNRIDGVEAPIETSAQPLAFHDGKEVADVARGFVFEDDTGAREDCCAFAEESSSEQICVVQSSSTRRPNIAQMTASESERLVLQSLALTILGQLTRQGLVNPIAISETIFSLLFHSKDQIRDKALDVLKEGVEILSEDVLINNRLPRLLNQAFLGLFSHFICDATPALQTLSICCRQCGLPNPMAPSAAFQSRLLTFTQLYQNCLQIKRGSSERFLYYICSTLEGHIERSIMNVISLVLQQVTETSEACMCGGRELIRNLIALGLPMNQSFQLLVSIIFSRWISEILLSLPYRLESEVLFVNHTLAQMLLKEMTPFSAAEVEKKVIPELTPTIDSRLDTSQSSTESVLFTQDQLPSSQTTRAVDLSVFVKFGDDLEVKQHCLARVVEVASLCMSGVIIKTILKRHFELSDEECMTFNPSSSLGVIGSKEVITLRRNPEDDDEICDDLDDASLFDVELWKVSLAELTENVIKIESLSTEKIIKHIGGLLWPRLAGAFDVHSERVDAIPRSLLSRIGISKSAQRSKDSKGKRMKNDKLKNEKHKNDKSKRKKKKKSSSENDSEESYEEPRLKK